MKFSLSWLREHLETDRDLGEIADTLTMLGLEVEDILDRGLTLAPFIVGQVVDCTPHPDADRLRVCVVETGSGQVQVVCGAPNARVGLKGVFAAAGTHLPGTGLDLKKTKIRGVESAGMLCSALELGLGDDHDGIIELDDDATVGAAAAAALGLDDPVIDIAVTPNRADCLGVHGIARDLAAAGMGTLKPLEATTVKGGFASPIGVTLDFPAEAATACPLFIGRTIRGVKNGPSPDWLRQKLLAVGLKPISALVDITNFFTLDRCRPLHVFDADTLAGDLSVRLARPGESLEALDGKTYELDGEMTAIADANGVLSLGGVIGGVSSGCTETTTNVFVEAALFDPIRTAQTGRKLNIESDARFRFERGIDPASTAPGMDAATALILELCGGEASTAVTAGAVPKAMRTIRFDPARVMSLGGVDLAEDESVKILESLGFATKRQGGALGVSVPSWRGDVENEAGLVEEVLRVHGYGNIPETPFGQDHVLSAPVEPLARRRLGHARRALAARGLNEAVSWSFLAGHHARLFGGGDGALRLANPISADLTDMRPSLLPNLIAALGRNADRGEARLALFEVGPVYRDATPEGQAMAAAGVRAGADGPRHWQKQRRDVDLFDAKGDALAALAAAGAPVASIQVEACAPPWFHPGRAGCLRLGPKAVLAHFGEIHPKVVRDMDVNLEDRGPVVGFELYFDAVPLPRDRGGKARPPLVPSPFQAVERDFAFVVDEAVSAAQVVAAAKGAERKLIAQVYVFDLYTGDGQSLGSGKKSIAIAVHLQPTEATLTEAEIDGVANKVVDAVAAATGATLRA